jgi:hypothetical protein
MKCVNPNRDCPKARRGDDCLWLGGPPPQCILEGQHVQEQEIGQQGTPQEPERPFLSHVVMCGDGTCCGTLIEDIVHAPHCNECGRRFSLVPLLEENEIITQEPESGLVQVDRKFLQGLVEQIAELEKKVALLQMGTATRLHAMERHIQEYK